MDDQITQFVTSLATSHGWALTVLAVIGGLRICFKPLMGLLHAVADSTPSTKDNELLDKAEASKVYKTVCWLIDLIGSIKVGTQKPTAPTAPAK